MPIKITVPSKITFQAKEIRLCLKVRDEFTASLHDEAGVVICLQEDGYVPSLMPDKHYGDYVKLNIDLETGQITNWQAPSAEVIEEFVAQCEGDG